MLTLHFGHAHGRPLKIVGAFNARLLRQRGQFSGVGVTRRKIGCSSIPPQRGHLVSNLISGAIAIITTIQNTKTMRKIISGSRVRPMLPLIIKTAQIS
jgi:hypothetical protein